MNVCRREMLGGLEESFSSLETASKDMVDQVSPVDVTSLGRFYVALLILSFRPRDSLQPIRQSGSSFEGVCDRIDCQMYCASYTNVTI